MDEVKFGRILEIGMGAVMSLVLTTVTMLLIGAPMTLRSVLFGWAGAFAIAVAINYFFPVMSWCTALTKNIRSKTAEYIIRVALFSFIEILFNSLWCMVNANLIEISAGHDTHSRCSGQKVKLESEGTVPMPLS